MHLYQSIDRTTPPSAQHYEPESHPADPAEAWAKHFAECGIRLWPYGGKTGEVDYNKVQPVPDDERPLTSINEIAQLPAGDGAYAKLAVILWVLGKWQTAGPCEQARPHYDAWKAAPNDQQSAESFYDALFQELRHNGRFLTLVDETMADWKRSGRLERRVHLYRTMHPDVKVKDVEQEIKHGLLTWQPPAGIHLDQRLGWNLIGEADHRANRIKETEPELRDWPLKAVMLEWQLWHENNVTANTPPGQRFDAGRQSRVLNKMLILKQILDVSLARKTAQDRVGALERTCSEALAEAARAYRRFPGDY